MCPSVANSKKGKKKKKSPVLPRFPTGSRKAAVKAKSVDGDAGGGWLSSRIDYVINVGRQQVAEEKCSLS